MQKNHEQLYNIYDVEKVLIRALIYLAVVSLTIMSITVWGLLNKSQDDPETIEEAINRIVAEHNADPTAHTGLGQSIDLHRKNDILDHPAGSVVGDKMPFQEYQIPDGAATSEKWSEETGTAYKIAGHDINVGLWSQTLFQGVHSPRHRAGANYPDADLILQFSLTLNGFQSTDGYFKFAFTNDLVDDPTVLQFEKTGTAHRVFLKKDGVEVASQVLSNANNTRTIYRIYYEHLTNTIYIYEGATVALTYTATNFKDFIFSYMVLEMSRTTNTSLQFRIRDWKSTFSFAV